MAVHEKDSFGARKTGLTSRLGLLEWFMRKGGRLVGFVFCGVALLFLVGGIFLGYSFFYVDNRLLFIFPGMAEKVSLDELAAHPAKYDGRWVRVRGQLRSPARFGALLVPEGTTPSEPAVGEKAGAEGRPSPRTWNVYPSLEEKTGELPPQSLRLHHPSAGMSKTVSFYEEGVVEVAGRYEGSGPAGEGKPSLTVAVMAQPRQPVFFVPIVVYGTIPVLAVMVSLPLYLIGRDIRRSFDRP
jgi:hypothetical protein